ncbi:hypothetical protein ABPG74_010095 [Tetrahymena malaccensis]
MMYANERDWKFFFLMISLVNILFGSLFILFREQPGYHGNCNNKEFLNWTLISAFSCFLMGLLSLFTIILVQCGQKFFSNLLEYSFYACIIYSHISLMGLNSSKDSDCGQLYTLTLFFVIVSYVLYILIFFVLCLTLCIFYGMVAIRSEDNAGFNQQQVAQIPQQQQDQQQLLQQQQDPQQQPLNNGNNQNYQAI